VLTKFIHNLLNGYFPKKEWELTFTAEISDQEEYKKHLDWVMRMREQDVDTPPFIPPKQGEIVITTEIARTKIGAVKRALYFIKIYTLLYGSHKFLFLKLKSVVPLGVVSNQE